MPALRIAERPSREPVRILLIEDEQVCVEIAKAHLARISWAAPMVEAVGTLREALARLTLEQFDLVITDLNLPDSRGLATLEAVAAACDRLIIVLTSEDDPELRDRALSSGAYDLLQKGRLSEAAVERLVRLATVQAGTVRSLRDSEARFRKTFELAGSGIAHLDLDGRFLRVNRKLCEILGYAESELTGRSLHELALPVVPEAADGSAERRFRRKDGRSVWVAMSVAPVRDAAGAPQYEIAVLDDITARKESEARQATHARYQESLARFGHAALARTDREELLAEAVQTARRGLDARGLAYLEPAAAGGAPLQRAAVGFVSEPGSAAQTVLHSGALFLAGNRAMVPVRADRRVRGALYAEAAAPLGGEALAYLATVASLLSTGLQRIESEERVSFLSQFDPLTGLANRELFTDRFAQMIGQAARRGTPLAVLFVDLDDFKAINDTRGHRAGDELLREAAKRLQAALRTGDTLARVSGDEFAAVLADLARPEDAALVAQKILEALSRPFTLLGEETFLSACVGIAAYPADGADAGTLLAGAEAAMYRAKQAGRNGYQFFTAEITQRTRARAGFALELRRALERDEFRLAYQPKVQLDSGVPCGLEALLRWEHPERGVVLPSHFVPVLEDTGLIVPVGEWVIRRACADVKAWQAAGMRVLPVAVNLSARQFRHPDLDARVIALVKEAGMDASLLELEITESELMQDPEHAVRVMRSLREAGIRMAIDDFGTGYSSLAYLTRFPLAALKIDRSFVADALTDAADAAIVRTIIDMAHRLRFTVVAEGIESPDQRAFLSAFGCEQGQGYLFARPMSAQALGPLMR